MKKNPLPLKCDQVQESPCRRSDGEAQKPQENVRRMQMQAESQCIAENQSAEVSNTCVSVCLYVPNRAVLEELLCVQERLCWKSKQEQEDFLSWCA
jgi:hypothetical protein